MCLYWSAKNSDNTRENERNTFTAEDYLHQQRKTHRSVDFVIKRIACLLFTTLTPLTETSTSSCIPHNSLYWHESNWQHMNKHVKQQTTHTEYHRQTDRQRGRQTDRQTETHIHTNHHCRWCCMRNIIPSDSHTHRYVKWHARTLQVFYGFILLLFSCDLVSVTLACLFWYRRLD